VLSLLLRAAACELLGGWRSRFAATPLWARCDHFGSRHDGFLRFATKTDLLCHCRTPLRIGRCSDRVIRWQPPADAIFRGFKPMSDAKMPAEHPAAISAFEADDMVVLHRSPDRDCRRRRGRRRRRRALAEANERAMHFCNQARELIDADSILRDVATDDPRNQAEINRLRGTFFNHIFCPNVRAAGGLCSRERLVLQFIERKIVTASRRGAALTVPAVNRALKSRM
jgi:hypothetical protein